MGKALASPHSIDVLHARPYQEGLDGEKKKKKTKIDGNQQFRSVGVHCRCTRYSCNVTLVLCNIGLVTHHTVHIVYT